MADLQPRGAEQGAGLLRRQAAKNTASPGPAPAAAGSPDRSSADRCRATGPESETCPPASMSTYARPRAPRALAHSCQLSSSRRDWAAPPGMTTAPTWGAWKTRNEDCAKYPVRSASSQPKRRSGLSEPNLAIASA